MNIESSSVYVHFTQDDLKIETAHREPWCCSAPQQEQCTIVVKAGLA